MSKLLGIIAITFICLNLVSCNRANPPKNVNPQTAAQAFDKQKSQAFIDSVNHKISEQFAAGDSVGLASHYWQDAELLLPNSEAIKGNALIASWGAMTRSGIKEFTFTTTDLTGDSEYLIETGTYEMKDARQTLIDKGKYVVIWQQRNGEWKLYRDIGNTSLPASK